MKKKLFKLVPFLIAFSLCIPVQAAELESVPETEEIIETLETVETAEDEININDEDPNNPYVYFDPADSGAGADYIDGLDATDLSEQPSAGCGYVTFVAQLPTGMENVDKVTMECFNMSTYKDYAFNLYHINDYTTHAELPYGEYYIYAGGFVGDAISKYPIEKLTFTVTESNNVIRFQIGSDEEETEAVNVEEVLEDAGIETETVEIEETEESTAEEEPVKDSKNITPLIEFILLIGVCCLGGFAYYKKLEREKEEE